MSKAFFRYGASKATYRADEVVSGRMTPTDPFPALTRSVSFDMYEKSCVNELMLRSDGTTAGDVVAVLLPPPQAAATSPTNAIAGSSFGNLIWFSLLSKSCRLLPGGPGRECAGRQFPTQ